MGQPIAAASNSKELVNLTEGEGSDKYLAFDCDLTPVPFRKNTRLTMFVAAPSQAGKTTFVTNFTNLMRSFVKIEKIYVFSDKDDDDLDKLGGERVVLDDDFLAFDYNPKNFEDALFIFDDIDSVSSKQIRKKIFEILERCLKLGGAYNNHLITTYHMISNHNETRYILFEAQYVVIFPRTGTRNQFKNLFQNYIGIDKEYVEDIMDQRGRWVCIHKNYPRYFVSQCEVQML